MKVILLEDVYAESINSQPNSGLWEVLRKSYPNESPKVLLIKEYLLQQNDIIKLGRISLKIKEWSICASNNIQVYII